MSCQDFGNMNNNRYVKDLGAAGTLLALNGTIITIPEPATVALLTLGLVGLLWRRIAGSHAAVGSRKP